MTSKVRERVNITELAEKPMRIDVYGGFAGKISSNEVQPAQFLDVSLADDSGRARRWESIMQRVCCFNEGPEHPSRAELLRQLANLIESGDPSPVNWERE